MDELMAARLRLQATLDSEFNPHVLLEAVYDETGELVDFLFLEANPVACSYLGMSHDDLVGARLVDVQPGHRHSGVLEIFRRVMEMNEPLRIEDFAYRQETMGGAERRYDFQAACTDNGVSCTWRDVTDQHAFHEALAVAEEMPSSDAASRAESLASRIAHHVEITAQLRAALSSRTVIEQALGIIMAQSRCDADAAFSMLRSASQNRNVKLRVVAAEMVQAVSNKPPAEAPPFVD